MVDVCMHFIETQNVYPMPILVNRLTVELYTTMRGFFDLKLTPTIDCNTLYYK